MKSALALNTDVVIPMGIKEGLFTTLVWDNIDLGEETRSGAGTTHMTNGIIIQCETDLIIMDQKEKIIC